MFMNYVSVTQNPPKFGAHNKEDTLFAEYLRVVIESVTYFFVAKSHSLSCFNAQPT